MNTESNILTWKMEENWKLCLRTMKNLLGDRRGFRFISHVDKQRMLILDTWADRYRLPVEWVLEELLRWYGFRDGRWKLKRNTLPVRISTLVSPASEDALKEIIAREFPNDEHLDIWKSQAQEAIIADIEYEEVRSRNMLDFESHEEYVTWYRRKVDRARSRKEKLLNQLQQSRPYRGNPFK